MLSNAVPPESLNYILWFDRNTPWTPHAHTHKQLDDATLAAPQSGICCAQCRHRITEHTARLELAGAHIHVFTNPGGFVYEIALYDYADCISHGPATPEYSWFPGYAWQLALCANCQVHLGWRYRKGGSAAFYGLIRERLLEVDN
jgi:hypothetical protein